jgi:ribosomal protein L29
MDFSDLKIKSQKELREILQEQRSDLRHLRFGAQSRQLKQVSKFSEVKKTIARILTLLRTPVVKEKQKLAEEK